MTLQTQGRHGENLASHFLQRASRRFRRSLFLFFFCYLTLKPAKEFQK